MRRLLRLRFLNGSEATSSGTAANFVGFLSHDDILVGMKL